MEDNEKITLALEKANENIWTTIIKGDQEIDGQKVSNVKNLTDFDGETQVYSMKNFPYILKGSVEKDRA